MATYNKVQLDELGKTAIHYLRTVQGCTHLYEHTVVKIEIMKQIYFGTSVEKAIIEIKYFQPDGSFRDVDVTLPLVELREHYKRSRDEIMQHEYTQGRDRTTLRPRDEVRQSSPLGIPKTWDTVRPRLLKMFAVGSPGYATLKPLRIADGKVICRCVAQLADTNQLCDHVLYAYLTSMDNKLLLLNKDILSSPIRTIQLPIGMGSLWIPGEVSVAIEEETNEPNQDFLLVSTGLEIRLCAHLAIPDLGPFAMKNDEGLLGYVRYLEDLIRSTEQYGVLMADRGTGMTTSLGVAGGCGRHHGPASSAMIIAGMRSNNPLRESWIIANVASLLMNPVPICLGCHKLSVGANDVPEF